MTIQGEPLEAFYEWRSEAVRANSFHCTPIAFDDSREWQFVEGYLRHRTGGWFFLAGVVSESRHPHLNGQQQLIIVQREIAINGFLACPAADGAKVLFQGRVEPGNIGGMQLAPTVQSTVSNYKRLHGGKPTAFIDGFLAPDPQAVVFDGLQSEEATRYLGKSNRNVMVRVSDELPVPEGFRWYRPCRDSAIRGVEQRLEHGCTIGVVLRGLELARWRRWRFRGSSCGQLWRGTSRLPRYSRFRRGRLQYPGPDLACATAGARRPSRTNCSDFATRELARGAQIDPRSIQRPRLHSPTVSRRCHRQGSHVLG